MGRRLLERLEQRVLPIGVEQLGFVDDEDLAGAEHRGVRDARLVDMTVAGGAPDHLLAQQADGDVELLSVAQFTIGAGGREFLADEVHVRVGALTQELRTAGITPRREGAQVRSRRLGVHQERRQAHRERALAHAHRTRHDPGVVRAT